MKLKVISQRIYMWIILIKCIPTWSYSRPIMQVVSVVVKENQFVGIRRCPKKQEALHAYFGDENTSSRG